MKKILYVCDRCGFEDERAEMLLDWLKVTLGAESANYRIYCDECKPFFREFLEHLKAPRVTCDSIYPGDEQRREGARCERLAGHKGAHETRHYPYTRWDGEATA
jgi:hypothetical protein